MRTGQDRADPREWRPQRIGAPRRGYDIVDPIVEPLWSGTRVMAHFRESPREDEWGDVEVLDEAGVDATPLAPVALEHLRRSVRAADAVIDGIVTAQATPGGEGTRVVVDARAQPLKRLFIGGRDADITFSGPKGPPRVGEPAFVALDLLRVDGEVLLDVPLLERKRILEGLIEPSDLVRVSPWVRPPLRQWFTSWRSAGFRGLILKSSNSRYLPSSETLDWAVVERMPR
jgi:hypothetical protein